MKYTDLILNNFKYDIEDDIWYDTKSSYRAMEIEYLNVNDSFKLYYGGFDIYLGEFSDKHLFLNKIKYHKTKLLRLNK